MLDLMASNETSETALHNFAKTHELELIIPEIFFPHEIKTAPSCVDDLDAAYWNDQIFCFALLKSFVNQSLDESKSKIDMNRLQSHASTIAKFGRSVHHPIVQEVVNYCFTLKQGMLCDLKKKK